MSLSISVLYIHPVGTFGGASRSLIEMIRSFPEGSVSPHVITQKGSVVDFLVSEGVPVIQTEGISQFDNTHYGYYRRLRWLLLLREAYFLPFTLFAILRATMRWKNIDIIHINELTALLPIIFAKLIFRKPVVVHVRSLQRLGGNSLRVRFVNFVLERFSDRIIAIDNTVRRSFPEGVVHEIVHNGFSPESCIGLDHGIDGTLQEILSSNSLKVAMVGNLLPMKGVYEFVEAANLCWQKNMKVYFIIVGENTRQLKGIKGFLIKKFGFAYDVRSNIEKYILENRLEGRVHLFGAIANIQKIYENIDILCFPSHLNAVGRPVFEAALSKVPSIVAIKDPLDDTIINGKTGLCIEPKNPEALARAIEYFYSRPDEIKRMGEAAYRLTAENFDIKKNAQRMVEIYEELLNGDP